MKKVFAFVGFVASVGVSVLPGTALISETGCNASSEQLQKTLNDGITDAGCILAQVFAGNVTPLGLIGQCANATEQVIVDVIQDFEAQSPDAGVGTAYASAGWITAQQKQNCDAALANAKVSLATKAGKK